MIRDDSRRGITKVARNEIIIYRTVNLTRKLKSKRNYDLIIFF